MDRRARVYDKVLGEHLTENRQMAFVVGPRQVGKSTTCRGVADTYLDWDNEDHRSLILQGPGAVAAHAGLDVLRAKPSVIVLDELHKYKHWKRFLKGFFDLYETCARIVVTGSSRMDVYRRGGDSMMGRYFLYHMHPLTVAELGHPGLSDTPLHAPVAIPDTDWTALWEHGGYPEPFLRRSSRFSLRWRELRNRQLIREDVRDLTSIGELDLLEVLARMLANRSGEQIVYRSLASDLRVSENTVRAWIGALTALQYGFIVRPWFRNVTKGLTKQPKWFLRDWGSVVDPGRRAETLCACHLLKAVDLWTDLGLGKFALHYVRDAQKREVDFLVVRDDVPWFLAEVKVSETAVSPALKFFMEQTGCPHAFQVVMNLEHVDADCFGARSPVIVPARTFLSQLV